MRKILFLPVFLLIISFIALPSQSQTTFRIMNVSFLFGDPYTGDPSTGVDPTNFIGECGGDLPKVCTDLGFTLPEGPGKQSGLGVDRTLCTKSDGTQSYQYSCDISGINSDKFIDKIDPISRVLTYKSDQLKGPIQYILHDILSTGFPNNLDPFVFTKSIPPLYSTVQVLAEPNGLVVIKPEEAVRKYDNTIAWNDSCVGDLSEQFTNDFYRMDKQTAAKNGFEIVENSCTGLVGQKLKYHVQVHQRGFNYEKQNVECKQGGSHYNQFYASTGPEPIPFPYIAMCEPDSGYRPLLSRDYEQTGQWGWPTYFPQRPRPGSTYSATNQYSFCEAFDMEYEDVHDSAGNLVSYIFGASDSPRCFLWPGPGDSVSIKQLSKILVWNFPYIFNPGSCGVFDSLRQRQQGGGKAGFNDPASYRRDAADIMCKKPILFNNPDYEDAERSGSYIFEPSKTKTDPGVQFLNNTVRPFFEQTDRLNQEYFSGPSKYRKIQFHLPVLTSIEVTDLQGNILAPKQQQLQNTTVTLYGVEVGQKIKIKAKVKELDSHNTSIFVFQSTNFGWGMFGPTQGGQVPIFGCDFIDSSTCLQGDVNFNNVTLTGPLHQNLGGVTQEKEIEFVYEIPLTYRAPLVGTTSLNPGDPYPLFIGFADEFSNFDSVKILFEIVPPICANQKHDASSGETDLDCGGQTCPTCLDGQRCNLDSDCQSGWCYSGSNLPPKPQPTYGDGICRTPTCSDGIQNQGETAVDCGGTNCAPCGGCQENWITSPWSACKGGQQTRIVRDTNSCNNPTPVNPRPATQRSCVNLAACVPTPNQCGGSNGCQILPYLNGVSCGSNQAGVCFAGSCYLPTTKKQPPVGQCLQTDWSPCEKHSINNKVGFYQIRNVVKGNLNVACTQLPPDQRPGAVRSCSPQAGPGPRDLCQQSLIASGFDTRLSTDFTSLANLNSVEGFKIGNQFGQIEFLGKSDLSSIDCSKLNNVFKIERNKVFVDTKTYPTFNQQAVVSLFTKDIKDPIVKTWDNQCIQVQVIRWNPDTGLLTFKAPKFSGYQAVEKATSGCTPQTPLALLLMLILIPIGAVGFLLFYMYYRNKKLLGHEFLWEKYVQSKGDAK